jgi:hypothetical protein
MICVNLKITNFYTGPSLRAFGALFRPVRMALAGQYFDNGGLN